MASQVGDENHVGESTLNGVREIDDEDMIQFIVGFPCTHFHCMGILDEGRHMGRDAVICSACEYVYYVLDRPKL